MKKFIILFIAFLSMACLIGCDEQKNYDDQVKVTFNLEGGTYMNCTNPVVLYFDFKENQSNLICTPTDLTNNLVERSGYELIGWFKTKNVNGDTITYSDEFDFGTDSVDINGVSLYAYWKKITKYSYNVCWYNSNNELKILGTYAVEAGEKFEDYSNFYKRNYGYTALGYYDEAGNPWNSDFVHPGGEDDLAINVIVKYIEGTYTIVNSSDDLGTLIKTSQNIYLNCDVDLEGKDFSFDNYRGTIIGNGHTISNFNLSCRTSKNDLIQDFEDVGKMSLCISLFGNTNGATIKDVNFTDVTIVLETGLSTTHKIYVAPISVSMKNTKVSNVNFNGTFEYTRLPDEFNVEENLIVINDLPYYLKDDSSSIENVVVNLKNKNIN